METVRSWLWRFRDRAEMIRGAFWAVAYRLDPLLSRIEPRPTPVGDALEAIGVAAASAARLWGGAPVWSFASLATGGMLLANTSLLYSPLD